VDLSKLCDENNDLCVDCFDNDDCQDEWFCNGVEVCSAGECGDGPDPCPPSIICDEDADACVDCVTNNDCNNSLYCDGTDTCVAGVCQHSGNPCSEPTPICNEASDSCVECLSAGDCSDGQFCDGAEQCVGGACQEGSPPVCNDNNICTNDSCDTGINNCRYDSIPGCCVTDNDCVGNTECGPGNVCVPTGGCTVDADCNDENPCTNDTCSTSNTCLFVPNTAPCDDGDLCTINDHCFEGACEGDPLCDDGNPCTTTECNNGVCGVTQPGAPPKADIIIVVEASRSMRDDFKRWIPQHLGPFPQKLVQAGIDDYRLAIVRFGTNRNQSRPKRGPMVPDVLLDWTTEQAAWENALAELLSELRAFTEAGTEAIEYALDNLSWRPGAVRNVILYTDEDNDAPAYLGGKRREREPPRRGPMARPSQLNRWTAFQDRLDVTAARLIADQVQLHMVINRNDRPTVYQYGDPKVTRLESGGSLNTISTLNGLEAKGAEGSLQGQLLSAGECRGNQTCTAGRLGSPCVDDHDCAITARAYQIPKNQRQADALFPGLIADILAAQICEVP
jgi:hypothetical protein